MFRVEEAALKKENLDGERQIQIESEMKSWIGDMKKQDELVKEIKPTSKPEPPIRKGMKASQEEETKGTPTQRIKSTDYEKWDKFDAEAAELKIDLDEERQREMVDLKNKKNTLT